MVKPWGNLGVALPVKPCRVLHSTIGKYTTFRMRIKLMYHFIGNKLLLWWSFKVKIRLLKVAWTAEELSKKINGPSTLLK